MMAQKRNLLDATNIKILELSRERPVHPDDLAQLFGISRAAVDQRASKLIAAGLVEKIRGQNGRVYIACTSAGAKVLERVRGGEPAAMPAIRKVPSTSVIVLTFFAVIALLSALANLARGSFGLAAFSAAFWFLVGLVAARIVSKLNTQLK
ncbi:TPA: ArsR family transcriptional regulator [Candidatus Micrarchaeota archaeon]|nr:ArsR family transcriptional regulator [Candidatus Micrarchaeota archaeon]